MKAKAPPSSDKCSQKDANQMNVRDFVVDIVEFEEGKRSRLFEDIGLWRSISQFSLPLFDLLEEEDRLVSAAVLSAVMMFMVMGKKSHHQRSSRLQDDALF